MFLMVHLYQIANLITNDHYIFKQISESAGQIMSHKMFFKTPSTKIEHTNVDCWPVWPATSTKQNKSSNNNLFWTTDSYQKKIL